MPRVLHTGPVSALDDETLHEMRLQTGPIMGPLLQALADSLDPKIGGQSFNGLAKLIGVSYPVLCRLAYKPSTRPSADICERIAEYYGLRLTGSHGRSSVGRRKTAAATGRKSRTAPQG
jgi:hypothetical protein